MADLIPGVEKDTLIFKLARECVGLSRAIERTRHEVAAMRPTDLHTRQLPQAGQELTAVVQETEEAANTIMTAAEEIMSADPKAGDYPEKVQTAAIQIIEACAFQDITGQRLRKVVQTLVHVEDRLAQLRSTFGNDLEDAAAADLPEGDAALLNGPQLSGKAIDQNDVDALFDDGPDPAKS
ncbi:protein phosphatase CheZ [Marinibaculum pumilum]|uniref:Protein phosphatase CheZ n=1 Tax=Marinibaculum pumilum TaxID=1766165 RepID=A0ABV7L2Q5_9PROT